MMAGALLIVPQMLMIAHQPPAADMVAVGGVCGAWSFPGNHYAPIHSGIMRQRVVLWLPPTCTTLLPGAMADAMWRRICKRFATHATAVLQAERGGGWKSLQSQSRRPRGWINFFTRRLFGFFPRVTG